MIKRNVLFKIAFVLFCVSFCVVIAAMAFHLNEGDSSDIAAFLAVASLAFASVGILFACLSKEKNESEDKSDEEEN